MTITSEIARLQQAKADIKTSIENKGVTVSADAKLDAYAALIDSISHGGWMPPSAELVGSNNAILNVANDTSFSSWTPSSANTVIKAAGTARAALNYQFNANNYNTKALIGANLYITDYVYQAGTTMAKGYSLNKMIYGISLYSPMKIPLYDNADWGCAGSWIIGRSTYHTNATTKSIYNSTAYGIGPTTSTISLSSSTSKTRTVGYTQPAIYGRCNGNYFSTAAAAAIDGANTNIYCYYRLWLIDKEESQVYRLFDATNGLLFE